MANPEEMAKVAGDAALDIKNLEDRVRSAEDDQKNIEAEIYRLTGNVAQQTGRLGNILNVNQRAFFDLAKNAASRAKDNASAKIEHKGVSIDVRDVDPKAVQKAFEQRPLTDDEKSAISDLRENLSKIDNQLKDLLSVVKGHIILLESYGTTLKRTRDKLESETNTETMQAARKKGARVSGLDKVLTEAGAMVRQYVSYRVQLDEARRVVTAAGKAIDKTETPDDIVETLNILAGTGGVLTVIAVVIGQFTTGGGLAVLSLGLLLVSRMVSVWRQLMKD